MTTGEPGVERPEIEVIRSENSDIPQVIPSGEDPMLALQQANIALHKDLMAVTGERDEESSKRSQAERRLASALFQIVQLELEVTDLKSKNKELEYEATHDMDTRLLNKRGMSMAFDVVTRMWPEPEQPHAVVFLDIDRFKRFNTEIGHVKTDTLVIAITEFLKFGLRDSDILGRVGGDEFVVILPSVGLEGAKQAADRLRETVKLIKGVEDNDEGVTLSAGVMLVKEGFQFYEAAEGANAAMRIAKEQGRDRTIVLNGLAA